MGRVREPGDRLDLEPEVVAEESCDLHERARRWPVGVDVLVPDRADRQQTVHVDHVVRELHDVGPVAPPSARARGRRSRTRGAPDPPSRPARRRRGRSAPARTSTRGGRRGCSRRGCTRGGDEAVGRREGGNGSVMRAILRSCSTAPRRRGRRVARHGAVARFSSALSHEREQRKRRSSERPRRGRGDREHVLGRVVADRDPHEAVVSGSGRGGITATPRPCRTKSTLDAMSPTSNGAARRMPAPANARSMASRTPQPSGTSIRGSRARSARSTRSRAASGCSAGR